MYMPAESSDSLDYKETPSHVEMAPSHFGGEGPHPSSLAEQSESAFMDGVGSDSSDTGSTDSDTDSDSSETEPDMDQEMTILSGFIFAILVLFIFCSISMVYFFDCYNMRDSAFWILTIPVLPKQGIFL